MDILQFTALAVLRPLARMLLRQGITAHQFARWADEAFVHAAVQLLEEQGTEPSFSRVAALTGIQRHAVSSLLRARERKSDPPPEEKEYQRNRLARVLAGWFEDPAYTDETGRPALLPLEGPAPSFTELVREYSGDIYPGIILDELSKVGAVSVREDGHVEVLSRRYVSGGTDPESFRHLGIVATDVLATLEHNMESSSTERRFEDASIAMKLPAEAVPMLARLLERRAASFLDDLDGWLSAAEESAGTGSGTPARTVRAGVRVVMIVDEHDEGDDRPPTR